MDTEFIEGQALVASPFLTDRNFHRSVVYIVKHDALGAYGLILNRPLNVLVSELLRQVTDEVVESSEPIYHGGPVEGPVVVVHERPTEDAILYEPGVYLTSDKEEFAAICRQSESRYRVFNGYAGWAPGQLEDELSQGGWLVCSITKDEIFAHSEEIWQTAVKKIGQSILTDSLHVAHIPSDPSAN